MGWGGSRRLFDGSDTRQIMPFYFWEVELTRDLLIKCVLYNGSFMLLILLFILLAHFLTFRFVV